jgi:hypothetical protein
VSWRSLDCMQTSAQRSERLLLALSCAEAGTYDRREKNCGVVGLRMHTAQNEPATWLSRWRRMRSSSRAEAQVALWKAAWLRGATTVWHGNGSTNPYDSDVQRAAWDAGAKWARDNPDRRTNSAPRFAHPRRRAGDSKLPAMLKRAVAVSATSLTLYAISRAFQKTKRTPD